MITSKLIQSVFQLKLTPLNHLPHRQCSSAAAEYHPTPQPPALAAPGEASTHEPRLPKRPTCVYVYMCICTYIQYIHTQAAPQLSIYFHSHWNAGYSTDIVHMYVQRELVVPAHFSSPSLPHEASSVSHPGGWNSFPEALARAAWRTHKHTYMRITNGSIGTGAHSCDSAHSTTCTLV